MHPAPRRWLSSALVLVSLSACGEDTSPEPIGPVEESPPRPSVCDQSTFELGNLDAQVPNQAELSANLFALSDANPKLVWNASHTKVLTAVWTTFDGYKPGVSTSTRDLFFTLAPELQEKCRAWELTGAARVARINQYLGLPPANDFDVNNRRIVEIWMAPGDLFRPCPDADVSDTTCGLAYPDNATNEHKRWLNNYWGNSYTPWSTQHYPFTGMGYTYDWCSGTSSHVGASEYVALEGKQLEVVGYKTTDEYCAP